MKFDGNYREETWETEDDDWRIRTTFVVDDEQVTVAYDLWAKVLTERGLTKVA